MNKQRLSIVFFVFIISLLCFCYFIKSTYAEEIQNNVLKTSTTGTYKWYSTLSSAVNEATDGDVIEIYKSLTETASVQIKKQNLTIKAADGYNPTISWTNTSEITISSYTKYNCVVIYTSVTTSTTLGGGTGVLTLDASLASDEDNKGKRARVLAHCGSGKLNLLNGIIIKGGKPGGGNYDDSRDNVEEHEVAEISGSTGNGAGVLMYNGTLNMAGGIIQDNYSLWGASGTHNLVGAGGGVCICSGATLNLSGGEIKLNAAGSGGGGGILVDSGGSLNITGGSVSENNCNFASGGGIAVNKGYAGITIKGGEISKNNTTLK